MMSSNDAIRPEKNKKIVIGLLLLAALCVAGYSFVAARHPVRVDVDSFKLGTLIRLSAWGGNGAQTAKALDDALSEITRLEHLFSVNIAGSEVSEVNEKAGIAPVAVSGETYELASRALYWAKQTDGAFDPAIGRVVALWGIGTDHARVPSDAEIRGALRTIDYRNVQLSSGLDDDYAIYLKEASMRLDFGAIAKGLVADFVADTLRRGGVQAALVDLGGNIVVMGDSPRGGAWKLGIQHPYKPRGEYFGVLEASDESVVTSGRYERFFEKEGVRYHHIFDPATGRPSQSDLSSVTVILKKSADADALSTALFVMGLEKARAFLKEHPEIDAILVTDEGENARVFVTERIAPRFSLGDTAMTLRVLD